MELYTRNHDPAWDRVVHICVDQCERISECINDKQTYKIVLVDSGSLLVESAGAKKLLSAPAVLLLTNEAVSFSLEKDVKTTTIFFRTTEIREEFTLERIQAKEFEYQMGRTIYQDYLLIKSFEKENASPGRILPLGLSAYAKISKNIRAMNAELKEQNDDFWPCRSRSYMMELLYFISYVCAAKDTHVVEETIGNDTVSEIMQYLSEHIGERILLEDIMKEFAINRNRLNELFIKETSMTCLNYFEKMKINLSQIMLAETELQIGEIAARVGYFDGNYFTKVFKKHTGVTPNQYRKSQKK